MTKKLDLLRAIYKALQWDALYEAAPGVTRQQVDEFFQEMSKGLSPAPSPPEATAGPPLEGRLSEPAAAQVAGAEAWLYTDGASKGNPGPAGIGMVLTTPVGEEVIAWGESAGRATNNVAEYRAVVEGLKKALELRVRRIRVLSDSELLILQLKGRYRVKSATLKPLHAEATALLGRFEHWEARHVARERNVKADALADAHAKRR